jgi:hypothetical protein
MTGSVRDREAGHQWARIDGPDYGRMAA